MFYYALLIYVLAQVDLAAHKMHWHIFNVCYVEGVDKAISFSNQFTFEEWKSG